MARTVSILITSDLSSKQPADTVEFAFDGRNYTVDLTESEKAEFAAVLEPYVAVAYIKTGRNTTRPARTQVAAASGTIRAWASAQGLDVPAKGRLPKAVVEQYEAANPNG
jgi:hypothetical protein